MMKMWLTSQHNRRQDVLDAASSTTMREGRMPRLRLLRWLLGGLLALCLLGLTAPYLWRALFATHGLALHIPGRSVPSVCARGTRVRESGAAVVGGGGGREPYHAIRGRLAGVSRETPSTSLIDLTLQTRLVRPGCRISDPGPWTWRCVVGRCVRGIWMRGPRPQVSLETCQWTCSAWDAPLWPRPTGGLHLSNSSCPLSPSLDVRLRPAGPLRPDTLTLLAAAARRLSRNLQLVRPAWAAQVACDAPSGATVDTLTLSVRLDEDPNRPAGHLTLDTDESYNLKVDRESRQVEAAVDARSFFGARHALETLSQLAWWDPVTGCVRMHDLAIVSDAPKFRHRGLMVDTARNFMPLEALMRTVDAMASNKLNTFHWHLTDSTSFPYLSRTLPDMAQYGAYSPEQVYSTEDISRLAEYARERGVRVVVELDVPSHAAAGWPTEDISCTQHRGLAAKPPLPQIPETLERRHPYADDELSLPWWELCGQPPCGQLPTADEGAFSRLRLLYQELRRASGGPDVAHLGGDEVSAECWGGLRGERLWSVWGGFLRRAHRELVTASLGQPPTAVLVWSSELTAPHNLRKYFDPSTHVVQVWGGSKWNETLPVLLAGYRAVVSHVDAWYLDCGWGDFRSAGPGACGPVSTWQAVYKHRPWDAFPDAARTRLLGGEACLWSEKVDEQTLDVRLWPRAAALAERLWSDPDPGPAPRPPLPGGIPRDEPTLRRAYHRLSHHRDRLVARGVRAEALWPRYCHQNPTACL